MGIRVEVFTCKLCQPGRILALAEECTIRSPNPSSLLLSRHSTHCKRRAVVANGQIVGVCVFPLFLLGPVNGLKEASSLILHAFSLLLSLLLPPLSFQVPAYFAVIQAGKACSRISALLRSLQHPSSACCVEWSCSLRFVAFLTTNAR